jgi:hypothetical protein
MKNTLLVLALALVATFTAQAQDSLSVSTSELKPVAGNRTAEVGFDFNSGTFLNGGQLRFRKFTSDSKAIRLGISAYLDNNNATDDQSATYAALSVTPGIERHFAGTKRLSPYIGAELPLSYAYSRYEDEYKNVKGAWSETGSTNGYVGIGLNGIAGVDLYIIENFYVGLEFGAGIMYKNYTDIEFDVKEHDFSDKTIKRGSELYFNTFSSGGLRLGFVF